MAGGIGQGLDFSVITEPAAVEDDMGDVLGFGALGDELADFLRAFDIRAKLGIGERFFRGEGADERLARDVIDDLRANVIAGEIDGQARTLGGAFDFAAHAHMGADAGGFGG